MEASLLLKGCKIDFAKRIISFLGMRKILIQYYVECGYYEKHLLILEICKNILCEASKKYFDIKEKE